MARVVVLGSINVDLAARVGRFPMAGETLSGSDFTVRAGGKGANQALAAARAGASVVMSGAVGRDGFTAAALANLAQAGVDLTGVRDVEGATGAALILLDAKGENVIVVVPGANATVDASQASALTLAAGDVLLLQGEIPTEALAAACAAGRRAGARVVLNPAPFAPALADLLPDVDVLVVNESEAQALAAERGLAAVSAREIVAALAAPTLDVIVTQGARGLTAGFAGRIVEAPSRPVETVDTVGAGDTFCGYLAAGLAQGGMLDDAILRRAGVAAALACTRPGAQDAIPSLAEVVRAGG